MTAIPGWAYTKNEREEGAARSARFKAISHLRPFLNLNPSPQYAQTTYTGTIPENAPELTDLDIALLCDSGNTCFGGSVRRAGRAFTCIIHTD